MRLLRAVSAFIASASVLTPLISASSTSRNPLSRLAVVQDPVIHTHNRRVTALSSFDLSLELYGERIRLSLEPNHDILPHGATVEYLGPDGNVVRSESIERLDHRVYKGTVWVEVESGEWSNAGWARIVVRRDGVHPLFEGAFALGQDHHHVQLASNYVVTKHASDPELQWVQGEDEFMVVWRDSDIQEEQKHMELKRDLEGSLACRADTLEFNTLPDHPVYTRMLRREDRFWGTPAASLFGKRQLDNTPGSGNSAGVNLLSTIGQTAGCPNTRKVALVGVATDCTYTASFNSTETARQNIITQMNSASDLYEKTFNITLGLRNLTVADASCPGSPQAAMPWNVACSGSVDIQDRLNAFSAWRGTKQDDNSHWTLLSTCNTGSAVGLAWLGQACVNSAQTTNSSARSETVSGANVVVRTGTEWQVIAHETGHTFGAVHDCTYQTCSDSARVSAQQCCPLSSATCDAGQRYIMNPSTSFGITSFSPCSIGNICSAMGRNSVKTSCFSNNRGVTTISGRQCGNGIVEEGEDCDCGGPQGCGNNACCDAATCKFKAGAVCDPSNEDCCTGQCQLASASTVCRASTGVCDPAETCSGTSPYCPADKTAPDGQGCGGGLKCASGQCTSRDRQCKTVMGSYTQGNDTYACDSMSCSLSCASPEFGLGVCYGLQQNFLDGTECGGGGHCQNGQCKGSSAVKELGSWISDHKGIVIGIAAALGSLLLFSILGCIVRSCRRRRHKPKPAPSGWQMHRRPPPPPLPPHLAQQQGGAGPQGGWQHGAGAAGWQPPMQQAAGWQQDAQRSQHDVMRAYQAPSSPPPQQQQQQWWAGPAPPAPVYGGQSVRYA